MAEATAEPASAAVHIKVEDKPTLTPPASEGTDKNYDSGSELSDLDVETIEKADNKTDDDDAEIEPDHYYEGGKIPVFKPTINQFSSFKTFISKIDKYGMKSGIVKVIPPQEWLDGLPALDEAVKSVKVKNPITQEFHGTHGTYTQANIEKQRTYNLPQWRSLCEESNHQPPAKRGERRRNQESVTRVASTRSRAAPDNTTDTTTAPKRRGPGRPRVRPLPATVHKQEDHEEDQLASNLRVPPTPTSPRLKVTKTKKEKFSDNESVTSIKNKGRQPKSVASRRQHNRRDQNDVIDEAAFKGFDYRAYDQSEWTSERCSELETAYWKGLTFNNPMYGADMPGSLFDDSTTEWNVAKLENLLDVLGQAVPGVNTAYLYLGMWKASFAWHLEDVDLYSINYIHFGAPKQWYSISQEDARRFEAAMRTVWPTDAKNCDQFLRHKTYLISPQLLQSQFNIRVNRLVHHEKEFVITFPYGYHSGYNLGYNCAESVNFATESWLDYGKVAKKCLCEADSVWVDVYDIERKLRGDPTPEYYEETDDDDEEDEDEDEGPTDLPTPPGSDKGKPKTKSRKRKRDAGDKDGKTKVKKLRIRLKAPAFEPCILCPNDYHFESLLPTDNGLKAHRSCGLYTPETWISDESGSDRICGINRIDKARLELKCNFCRSKKGAVFQCSQLKCTRAYHATCAIPAAVQVDIGEVPVYGDDGTEYKDTAIDFRCKIHRSKRFKNMDSFALEQDEWIRSHAVRMAAGDVVQVQYAQGDMFGGVVVENRKSEQTLLVEVLPKGDMIEVEYKWLLIFDPVNSHLPAPSANAKPLPKHLAEKSRESVDDAASATPKADQPFSDRNSIHTWSEFHTCRAIRNPAQTKIDLSMPKQLWFYLGKTSTENRAQFTGDLAKPVNDADANFLERVRPRPPAYVAPQPIQRKSFPATYPAGINIHAANAVGISRQYQQKPPQRPPASKERPYSGKYAVSDAKPYQYKPKDSFSPNPDVYASLKRTSSQTTPSRSQPMYNNVPAYRAPPAPMAPMAPMTPAQFKPTQQHNKPVDYKRPPSQPPQPFLPQSQTQPPGQLVPPKVQAPVANMMGTDSAPKPSSRPPPTRPRAFSNQVAVTRDDKRGVSKLDIPASWHYLHEAEKARPKLYQSPYAPEAATKIPRSPADEINSDKDRTASSLSESFLMQRTPSQQERVKGHIRTTSDTRVKMQQEKIRQQQEELRRISQQREQQEQQLRRERQALQSVNTNHISASHRHPSPLQNHQHSPVHSYNDFSATYNNQFPDPYASSLPNHAHSPTSYNSNPYPASSPSSTHRPSSANHRLPSPWSNLSPPGSAGGLQYQSPQEFKLQMQREAQQHSDWANFKSQQPDFNNFYRGLQTAAQQPPNGADVGGGGPAGGGGGQGSPLKYEFAGGGGEMLPMMRDA
ncbi:MAG: hypothetical protein Q9173_002683 [Seirophora scorigena]